MLNDLDLLTDEPINRATNDVESLRDQLSKALKDIDDLKVEQTRFEVENRDLHSKLKESERKEELEQKNVKRFAKELLSARNQEEEYKAKIEQSKVDAVRQKQTFTEIKKQLYKQLVQEKEKSKLLEGELINLKTKMANAPLSATTKAASALLGFFGKSDVDEKASDDGLKKVTSPSGSASALISVSPKASPRGQNLPSTPAPEKSAPTKVLHDSSDRASESISDEKALTRRELEEKTHECKDLRDEIQRLEDRLANISTSYDELLTETDEIKFAKDEADAKLNTTQGELEELKNQSALCLKENEELKEKLSSTSSQTRQTELDLNHRLVMVETSKKGALLKKEKEIESIKIEHKQEIANLSDEHEKAYMTQVQRAEKLSNDLQILKSSSVQQGLELEKMTSAVSSYREKLSDTNEKGNILEQRKKRLEKEKKALVKEIKRLKENEGIFDTKLKSEKESREQLESKINHVQEDHIKLSKQVKIIEEDRVKYKTLYYKAEQEREAAVLFHESSMKELKTKLKAVLDVGQAILMTLDNMKLEKLRGSTPGMRDVQRLQWANTEIKKSIMPAVRKQMSSEQELDSTARLAKSVLRDMLLTLCQTVWHSNIILLKVAEA